MSTILTNAIVENAKANVDEYVSQVRQLNQELQSVMTNLTSSSFQGDAAQGFMEYYTAKISPAVNESLVDDTASLTASIKQMLDGIQTQLMSTVDPQLGENNRSAGGQSV